MFVISSSTLFGNLAKGSNFGSKSVDFLVNGEQLEVFDHRGVRSITSGSSYAAAPRIAAMSSADILPKTLLQTFLTLNQY